MKTIILSEKQELSLIKKILTEETVYLGDKENLVIDWLNKHFKPMEIQSTDGLSLPKLDKAVSVLDTYGQMTKQLKSLDDVFYILQTKFKKILNDKKERDEFLSNTLNKWYN